jgi:hypothetical protein
MGMTMLSDRGVQLEGDSDIEGGSSALWTTRRPVFVDGHQFSPRLLTPRRVQDLDMSGWVNWL